MAKELLLLHAIMGLLLMFAGQVVAHDESRPRLQPSGTVSPQYPAMSRRLGEQGRVDLRVLVGVNGSPVDAAIERSSGYPRLDQAALAAVQKWLFVPARVAGEPTEAWIDVPITFTLREADPAPLPRQP